MLRRIQTVSATLVIVWSLITGANAFSADPELVSVKKIWDAGKHNAFTDLIRFRNRFYCTFREADAHVGGDGGLRVLVSEDGASWKSALLKEEGIDLRDPKLSITPDGRLMMAAGGSVYRGTTTIMGRQPRVAFSKDGSNWTKTQRTLAEGDWLWRVTWNDDVAYGVSYRTEPREKNSKASDWLITLYSSKDGVKYAPVTDLEVPGRPNETTLRFLPDDTMIAMVRREAGSKLGWIGSSKPPYTKWSWHETKHRMGGPNFIRLPNGRMWAGSRSYPGGAKTVLARMSPTSYEPVLTLPSRGDTSYPGLVWHDDLLWMSYYSSHEGKTSIYLAKIRLK
jgi:hypothetical protein